jgi:hypothetical protein
MRLGFRSWGSPINYHHSRNALQSAAMDAQPAVMRRLRRNDLMASIAVFLAALL